MTCTVYRRIHGSAPPPTLPSDEAHPQKATDDLSCRRTNNPPTCKNSITAPGAQRRTRAWRGHTRTRASCLCHLRMACPQGYHTFPGLGQKVLRGTSKSFSTNPGKVWLAPPGHTEMAQARSPRSFFCFCVISGGLPAGEALLSFGLNADALKPSLRGSSRNALRARKLERASRLRALRAWERFAHERAKRSQDQKRRSPRGRPPGVEGRRFVPRTACRRQPPFGVLGNRRSWLPRTPKRGWAAPRPYGERTEALPWLGSPSKAWPAGRWVTSLRRGWPARRPGGPVRAVPPPPAARAPATRRKSPSPAQGPPLPPR
ncbi:hypothetical protein SUDANB95_04775 [Actinosynnema sp. ALI-1.44]